MKHTIKYALLLTALTGMVTAAPLEYDPKGKQSSPLHQTPLTRPTGGAPSSAVEVFEGTTVHLSSQEAVQTFMEETLLYKEDPSRYMQILKLSREMLFITACSGQGNSISHPVFADVPGGATGRAIEVQKQIHKLLMGR